VGTGQSLGRARLLFRLSPSPDQKYPTLKPINGVRPSAGDVYSEILNDLC